MDIKEARCKVNKFVLLITDKESVDGGTTKISYGPNFNINDREQRVSIRHICSILCREGKKYYDNNRSKFHFINYRLVDQRN